MTNTVTSPIVVLGRGMAGLSAAIALGSAGYPVHLIGRPPATPVSYTQLTLPTTPFV